MGSGAGGRGTHRAGGGGGDHADGGILPATYQEYDTAERRITDPYNAAAEQLGSEPGTV